MIRPVRRTSWPFVDFGGLAEEHDADVVLFEVQRQAEEVVAEVDELAGHDLVEAVDSRDSVADGEHRADLGDVDRLLVTRQLLLQNLGDLVRFDVHDYAFALSFPFR